MHASRNCVSPSARVCMQAQTPTTAPASGKATSRRVDLRKRLGAAVISEAAAAARAHLEREFMTQADPQATCETGTQAEAAAVRYAEAQVAAVGTRAAVTQCDLARAPTAEAEVQVVVRIEEAAEKGTQVEAVTARDAETQTEAEGPQGDAFALAKAALRDVALPHFEATSWALPWGEAARSRRTGGRQRRAARRARATLAGSSA